MHFYIVVLGISLTQILCIHLSRLDLEGVGVGIVSGVIEGRVDLVAFDLEDCVIGCAIGVK